MICKLTKVQQKELDSLLSAYEQARGALTDWLSDTQVDWEIEIQAKSGAWQESEVGQAALERLDTLSGWVDEMPEALTFGAEEFA